MKVLAGWAPLVVALIASPARAGGLAMESAGCEGLDLAETERLLVFELAIVAARAERARAPVVKITCSANVLTVNVRDPVVGRSIEEHMPAPRANDPGRERVIALAASQVLLNGWLEMVLEPAPPRPRESAPVARPREAERAATGPSFELGFVPSARATARERRTVLFEPRLRFDVEWDHLYSGAFVFFDGGTASRAPGDIRVAIAGVGLGGGVALPLGAGWSWGMGASVAAGWVRLSADTADPGFRAKAQNGTLFELALETGPRLEVDRWRLGLELGGGVTLPTVVGRVEGDENVVLDGLWLRAGLGVARRFGGP